VKKMKNNLMEQPLEVTSLGIDSNKLGIWAFLSSETIFFSALIVTYLILHGKSVSGPYPHDVLNVPLTAVNTFVLICSSFTMVSALAAIQRGETRNVKGWLIATMVLGAAFLGGQATEFSLLIGQGLSLSQNVFGASFFTLTGFHGAHVLVGLIWIGFVLTKAFRGELNKENHLSVELVGLYWHFVDLVWIIIFTVVYLIYSAGGNLEFT
jgi:heme/copper-type cytochrome/quinol oxidase subunit 3